MEQFKLPFFDLDDAEAWGEHQDVFEGYKKSVLFMQDYLKRLIQYHKHYYLDYCQYKHGMAVALKPFGKQMLTEYYFAVRYGDIIILLYHEDMMSVRELLFKNSQKEKTLKRFLEYCYMIDVKVAFEGLKGEKTKGLKAALKFAKEQDMCMTEAQIQGANNT